MGWKRNGRVGIVVACLLTACAFRRPATAVRSPLWSYQPGPGNFTDPVIDGTRVYATFRPLAESSSQSVRLFAVNSATGHPVWHLQQTVSGDLQASHGLLYVHSTDHKLHALDGADGRERWTSPGPVTKLLQASAENDVYVLDAEGQLLSFDGITGKTRRRYSYRGGDQTRLTLIGTDRLLLSGKGIALLSRDREEPLWSAAPDSYFTARPEGSGLVIASDTKTMQALDISTGRPRWSVPVNGGVPQAISNGLVYYTVSDPRAGRNTIHVLDARTGAGKGTLAIPDFQPAPYGALNAADGTLYVPARKPHGLLAGFSNAADSALCAADGQTGEPRWCSAWQHEYLNEPVFSRGRVYITSTGEGGRSSALYCFPL